MSHEQCTGALLVIVGMLSLFLLIALERKERQ